MKISHLLLILFLSNPSKFVHALSEEDKDKLKEIINDSIIRNRNRDIVDTGGVEVPWGSRFKPETCIEYLESASSGYSLEYKWLTNLNKFIREESLTDKEILGKILKDESKNLEKDWQYLPKILNRAQDFNPTEDYIEQVYNKANLEYQNCIEYLEKMKLDLDLDLDAYDLDIQLSDDIIINKTQINNPIDYNYGDFFSLLPYDPLQDKEFRSLMDIEKIKVYDENFLKYEEFLKNFEALVKNKSTLDNIEFIPNILSKVSDLVSRELEELFDLTINSIEQNGLVSYLLSTDLYKEARWKGSRCLSLINDTFKELEITKFKIETLGFSSETLECIKKAKELSNHIDEKYKTLEKFLKYNPDDDTLETLVARNLSEADHQYIENISNDITKSGEDIRSTIKELLMKWRYFTPHVSPQHKIEGQYLIKWSIEHNFIDSRWWEAINHINYTWRINNGIFDPFIPRPLPQPHLPGQPGLLRGTANHSMSVNINQASVNTQGSSHLNISGSTSNPNSGGNISGSTSNPNSGGNISGSTWNPNSGGYLPFGLGEGPYFNSVASHSIAALMASYKGFKFDQNTPVLPPTLPDPSEGGGKVPDIGDIYLWVILSSIIISFLLLFILFSLINIYYITKSKNNNYLHWLFCIMPHLIFIYFIINFITFN